MAFCTINLLMLINTYIPFVLKRYRKLNSASYFETVKASYFDRVSMQVSLHNELV